MTIKSLLEKAVEFFINLRHPKTIKTQKTTTIKLNKTPINKISQNCIARCTESNKLTQTTTKNNNIIYRTNS